MKNILRMTAITAIYCQLILFSQSYGNANTIDDIDNVLEDSSMEKPVELKDLNALGLVREKETEYVKTHYSNDKYESVGRGLLMLNKNGRVIHTVLYKNEKGAYLGVFYDISTAFSQLQKSDTEKYEQLLQTLKRGGMTSEILDQ